MSLPIDPNATPRTFTPRAMPRFHRKALTVAILSIIASDVRAAETQPAPAPPAAAQPAPGNATEAQRGADRIEEMVVFGRTIETGQLRAINDQLEAKAVATIISKELFGQVNDGNIATSMQRMPGLSADGNGGDEIPRYINIRGISAAYNSVQVDGARMPASGTGRGADYGNTGRGFALDDLPSDAIEKVEIIKQPTPDMDADGLGGAVNLVTKSALDYDQRVLSFNVGGNYNALRDDVFPNGAGTYIERFEFNGGQRLGVQLTASYYDTNEGFDNRDIDYNPLITNAPVNDYLNLQAALDASGRTQTALGDDEERLQNVFYQEDTELNTFVIDRERFGFSGNFDFALDDDTSLFLKTLYNTEDQVSDDRRNHRIMDNDHNGSCNATFNPANPQACFLSRRIIAGDAPGPQVRLGSDPQRRSTIDFVTTERGRATLDANGVPRGQMRYVGNETETEIELFSLSFGGSHRFERGTLSASGNVASTENQFDQLAASFLRRGFAYEYDQTNAFRGKNADYRILNNEFSYLQDVDPNEVVVDATRRDTIRPNVFEVREGDASEDRMQFKVDYEHELPDMEFVSGTWKVGVKYQNMERSYDYDEVQYNLAAPGTPGYTRVPWAGLVRQNKYEKVDDYDMPFSPNPSALLAFVNDPANATNGTFVNNLAGAFDDGLQEDYEYEEDVYAAYGMVSVEAGPFELIAGARWEYTDQSVERVQFDFDENGLQETDVSNVTDERDYSVLLPSAILKWKVTDSLVLRFAVSETFARPQLLDLINTRRVNEQGNPVEIETGNFDLPPLEADNIDLVLEYYTEDGLWSAGLFRKDLNGFSFPALEIVENVAEFEGRDLVITTPLATGTARNQGIELSVFQRMSMLPAPWDGIFVNANYTYTDSQAEYPGRETEDLPTQGSSRHLAFASLGYEWRGLSMEIQYRYRSAFIEGLAFVDAQGLNSFVEDDVFGDTQTFNALLSYQLMDNVTVYVNGTNIFNEQNASRQGYKRYPEDVYYNERRIQFGVKGQF